MRFHVFSRSFRVFSRVSTCFHVFPRVSTCFHAFSRVFTCFLVFFFCVFTCFHVFLRLFTMSAWRVWYARTRHLARQRGEATRAYSASMTPFCVQKTLLRPGRRRSRSRIKRKAPTHIPPHLMKIQASTNEVHTHDAIAQSDMLS